MKQLKKFKKHRWFIWAVVVSFAGLSFLATYVYSVAARDEAQVPVIFDKAKNVVKSSVSVKLPVSQAQATYLVKNVEQVQTYLRTHSRARITPDDAVNSETPQNPYWPVHVYEDFKDHTKTYGWYYVYLESGVIVKQ